MIHYIQGDLLASNAQVLVNPVNCVGVMGGGLAKAFKNKYPDMFDDYAAMCSMGMIKVGEFTMFKNPDDGKVILNLPTKLNWRDPSELEYIEKGLDSFARYNFSTEKLTTFAFPKLGCGLGGLSWESQVKPLMESKLKGLNLIICVYEPEVIGDIIVGSVKVVR